MMFFNLKNSVNTRNGILEAVDFKILLGSMPLTPWELALSIPLLLRLAATGDLTTSPPPHFFCHCNTLDSGYQEMILLVKGMSPAL